MSAVDAQATAGQGPSAARQHAGLSHRGSYTEAARGTTAAPHASKAPHLYQAQHDSQLGGLAPAGGAAVGSAGRAPADSAPAGQQHEGHCLWGRAERKCGTSGHVSTQEGALNAHAGPSWAACTAQ